MFNRRFLAVGAASAVVATGILGTVLAASLTVPTTVPPMRPASGSQAAPAPHAKPGPIRAEPQPLADAVISGHTPDCRYPELLLICVNSSDNGD
ncbi:MAG TPA: hypothetical protein VF060_00980 [Trebonia sp.]